MSAPNVYEGPWEEPAPVAQYLPHDLELEESVLGAILLDNDCYPKAARILGPEDFYVELHARMFEAAGETIRGGRIWDARTAKAWLSTVTSGDDKAGEAIARIAGATAGRQTTIISYSEILADLSGKRRLAGACQDGLRGALNGGKPLEVAAALEEEIASVRAFLRRGGSQAMAFHAQAMLDHLGEAFKRQSYDGVCWPLPEIDSVMSGPMEAGNLYGFLAASGEGKTSCMLQIARAAAEAGHPTLLISYDQSQEQCLRQMCSQALGIAVNDLRKGAFSEAEFDGVYDEVQRIVSLPFEADKLARGKVATVMNMARAFVKRRKAAKPCLVMIDHIKRIDPERQGDDAGTRVNLITSALKGMSEELECATFLLNQRNSKGLARYSPRPIAEDLFGGSGAKEDYDAILTLYRPSMWLKERLKVAERDSDKEKIEAQLRRWDGLAEVSTLKNRYGEPGRTQIVKFTEQYTRFVSMALERTEAEPELV